MIFFYKLFLLLKILCKTKFLLQLLVVDLWSFSGVGGRLQGEGVPGVSTNPQGDCLSPGCHSYTTHRPHSYRVFCVTGHMKNVKSM